MQKAELAKKFEESEKRRVSIEEILVRLADEKENLESEKNAAEDKNDTLLARVTNLESQLDESQNRIQV